VLGQNPNRAARILMGGLLVLVGLGSRERALIRPRFLIWPLAAVIALAMIKGGSRGGLLALAIGLWTFMIAGKNAKAKLKNAAVSMFVLGAIVAVVLQSPLMQRRLALAGQGNFAKREDIFPAALGMFLERPLVGWGAQNQYELARRIPQEHRTSRDTHNLVLHVLTATGLLGGVPFFSGVALALWAAWRGRKGSFGMLPFALLLALMAGNMTGNYIVLKLQWVALALAFASSAGMPVLARRAARAPAQS
jgi:O-antigen ligase